MAWQWAQFAWAKVRRRCARGSLEAPPRAYRPYL
jgi:hypothetical protein